MNIYLVAALMLLLTLFGAAGISGSYFHDVGVKSERAWWQEKEVAQREQFEKEFAAAMQRVATQNEVNQQNLVETINEAEKRNEELANRFDAYRSQRLRVTAKATSCDRNQNEADKDPGIDGGGTGRVELSREDSEALWGVAFDAQRVVNQYLAVRQLVLDNTQCFEVVR